MRFYEIDDAATYFLLMRPIHDVCGIFGYTTTTDREKWVECRIVEENYKLSDGYKVEFRAVEDGYGKETFYQSDFKSMLDSGRRIVKKERDTQHCVEIRWIENLCGGVFLEHTAYTICG